MRERERKKILEQARKIEDEQMRLIYPLAVDETPEARIADRSDELEAFFTVWLFNKVWLPHRPMPLKRVIYGAAGDARREIGKGSAITFRRYVNQRVFESRPIYRLITDERGNLLLDAIRRSGDQ